MSQQNRSLVKAFFLTGAMFNWLITLAWFFAYPMIFPVLEINVPESPLFIQLFCALAFVFGLGYYLVAENPERGREIVIMGIVGKSMVLAIIAYYWSLGKASNPLMAIGCADGLFAICMLLILLKQKQVDSELGGEQYEQ